jgi:addiction module HigA family antidote
MRMKNPPHPGLSVRYECGEPLGLSVTEGAKVLWITGQAVKNLVSGKAGISAEMAIHQRKPMEVAPRRASECRPLMT